MLMKSSSSTSLVSSVLLNNSVPCTSVLLERDLLVGTVILLLSCSQLGHRNAVRSAWEQGRDL